MSPAGWPSIRFAGMLAELAPRVGFDYSIDVLGITVAALLTTDWIAPRMQRSAGHHARDPAGLLPGRIGRRRSERPACRSNAGRAICGGLPEFFGQQPAPTTTAPTTSRSWPRSTMPRGCTLAEILAEAARAASRRRRPDRRRLRSGRALVRRGRCVAALVAEGHRVSIDSMNAARNRAGRPAGAELVLSVNSDNREAAVDWGCEVVVVPDDPATLDGLDETIEFLAGRGVPLRIDPILEPIGFGFAASLGRYLEVRRRYPDAEMLMGIGNLTELTDADSAPINVLLLGFCQELGIRSVLTTQVINWARTSVRECDLARRLVHYAASTPHAAQATGAAAGHAARCRSAGLRPDAARPSWPTDQGPQLPPVRRGRRRFTPSRPASTCTTPIRFACSSSCTRRPRGRSTPRTRSTWASKWPRPSRP